jgi:hypothetical protein
MKFTKETLNRAVRTFLQALFGYFSVNLVYVTFTDDKATLRNTIIGFIASAVSAGIAAVMNLEKEDSNDE